MSFRYTLALLVVGLHHYVSFDDVNTAIIGLYTAVISSLNQSPILHNTPGGFLKQATWVGLKQAYLGNQAALAILARPLMVTALRRVALCIHVSSTSDGCYYFSAQIITF